jgi:hypothetical protein
MKAPAQYAQTREDHPVLPKGDCERVSGYGVMGLPFASGHRESRADHSGSGLRSGVPDAGYRGAAF